jgi:hypothetical protein
VVDKLRQLHHELDKGIVPKSGYAHYTVRQAANDWLASGLEGCAAKTVQENRTCWSRFLRSSAPASCAS